jgi:hypothetical protein
MSPAEIEQFNAKRRTVMPVQLTLEVQARIDAHLTLFEADQADVALEIYAKEKPYRGFFLARFRAIYDSPETAAALRRRGAPAENACRVEGETVESIQEAYGLLEPDFIAHCRKAFADYGWRDGSIPWMILCVDHSRGRRVSHLKVNAAYGTNEHKRRQERLAQIKQDWDLARQSEIERLRRCCEIMGEEIRELQGQLALERGLQRIAALPDGADAMRTID